MKIPQDINGNARALWNATGTGLFVYFRQDVPIAQDGMEHTM